MGRSRSSTLLSQATRHLVLEAVSSITTEEDSRSRTAPFQAIALDMVEAFTITMVRSLSSTVPSRAIKLLLQTLLEGVFLIWARSPSSIVPSLAIRPLLRGAASPSLAAELLLPFVPFMVILHTMVVESLFRIEEHNIVMWRWEIA